MKNRSMQLGYTLREILIISYILLTIGIRVGMIWVVIHFVSKFW